MKEDNQIRNSIIFFDGVCLLCHASVRFVIKNDPKARFSFASIQSPFAQEFLKARGIDSQNLTTLFLFDEGEIFTESTAILKIASRLKFPWNLLRVFILLPTPIRDPIYRWVARHRYQWWGKLETCSLPARNEESRFLK